MSRLDELITELCPDGVKYKKIGECCSLVKGNTPIQKATPGEYPLVVTTSERKTCSTFQFDQPSVCIPLVSSRGHGVASLNEIYYQDGKFAVGNILCCVTPIDQKQLSARFLYVFLNYAKDWLLVPKMQGGANVSLSVDSISRTRIPVPPLPVQQEIVRILDHFTELQKQLDAELTARKKQYEYYRDSLLTRIEDSPKKKLGETCLMRSGKAIQATMLTSMPDDDHCFPCYGGNGIRGFIKDASHSGEYPIIGRQGALCGNVNYANGDFYATEHAIVVKSLGEYNQRFLYYLLISMNLNQYKSQGAQPGLAVSNIEKVVASVPPLKYQEMVVSILDRFESLCNDLSSGLPAEIAARQKQYEYYRDKLLTFKELKKS